MANAALPLLLGPVGAAVYQGERQASAQRKALREQKRVQEQQQAAAGAEQRRAAVEERKANQKAPDAASLLSGAQEKATLGSQGTILTGAQGTSQQRRKLGGSSLLGGI